MDESSWFERTFSAISFKVLLEGLPSLVSDCDSEGGSAVGVPTKFEVRRALAQVYESISRSVHLSAAERLETLLRLHTICLDTILDSSLICRYVCSRYNVVQHIWTGGKGTMPGVDLVNWASQDGGRTALLHAMAIQDIVEQLPRGRAHPIHMPSSLFAATVYSVFALVGLSGVKVPSIVVWQDVLATSSDHHMALGDFSNSSFGSDTRRYIRGESLFGTSGVTRNLLYELNSMQKLFRCLASQWEVAVDMEAVVDQILRAGRGRKQI